MHAAGSLDVEAVRGVLARYLAPSVPMTTDDDRLERLRSITRSVRLSEANDAGLS